MAKFTGKSTNRRGKPENLVAPWKPGQSGNPAGRRKGQRDYKTIFFLALQRIAEMKNLSPEDVEDMMHVKAIEKAIKGDFFFYKELNERVHGKVTDKMDLNVKGKTLADLILAANNAKKRGAKRERATRASA